MNTKAILFYSRESQACSQLFKNYHIEWGKFFTLISVDSKKVRDLIKEEIEYVPTVLLVKNKQKIILADEELYEWLKVNIPKTTKKKVKKKIVQEEIIEEVKEEIKTEPIKEEESKNFTEMSGMGGKRSEASKKNDGLMSVRAQMEREREEYEKSIKKRP